MRMRYPTLLGLLCIAVLGVAPSPVRGANAPFYDSSEAATWPSNMNFTSPEDDARPGEKFFLYGARALTADIRWADRLPISSFTKVTVPTTRNSSGACRRTRLAPQRSARCCPTRRRVAMTRNCQIRPIGSSIRSRRWFRRNRAAPEFDRERLFLAHKSGRSIGRPACGSAAGAAILRGPFVEYQCRPRMVMAMRQGSCA